VKARAFASIVAAALVLGGITGCTFVTPVATQQINDVTDGVSVNVGDVKLLNALVITANGHSGNLVAQAYNTSSEPVTLSLQYDVDGRHTVTVKLAANGATKLGYGRKGQLLLKNIGTKAGGLLPLYVQYGSHQGRQIKVPVLSNRQGEYSKLDPTNPPKPTPTPTNIPGVTQSPTPSGSPTP
jgi:hypothetical protein